MTPQILFVVLAAVVLLGVLVSFGLMLKRPAKSETAVNREAAANVLTALREERDRLVAALENRTLSQADFVREERALAQRLLDEGGMPTATAQRLDETRAIRVTALMLAVVLPLLGTGLYLKVGDFSSLEENALLQVENARHSREAFEGADMMGAIERLEGEVQKRPNNLSAWQILADHYLGTGNLEQALIAYENVVRLDPKDDKSLVTLIDLMIGTSGEVTPRLMDLVNRALELNPMEPKILLLGGYIRYEEGDSKEAVLLWNRLLTVMPEGEEKAALKEKIADVMKAAGMTALPKDPVLERQS